MIGKIKGTLREINGNVGLIETASGLSYEVFLPPSLITHSLDSDFEIYTYFQVRDDAQILFGFGNKKDKELFRMLLSVSGVGPKTAFQIVSFSSYDELLQAITHNDVQYFSRIPGLGKKTAMKIILELSQTLKSQFEMKNMYLSEEDKTVIDALISLGYKAHDARQIIQKIPKDLPVEERIREGLKKSSPK